MWLNVYNMYWSNIVRKAVYYVQTNSLRKLTILFLVVLVYSPSGAKLFSLHCLFLVAVCCYVSKICFFMNQQSSRFSYKTNGVFLTRIFDDLKVCKTCLISESTWLS